MFGRKSRSAKTIARQRTMIVEQIKLLREANNAFDECTGPYARSLVKGEPWRQYRDPTADTSDEDRWDD